MSDVRVTIVDYGAGNLLSVQRAFEKVGASVILGSSPEAIAAASRLVLPGVGAFGDAMDALRRLDVVGSLREYAASGKPMLGICLGMQLLLDDSVEFGVHTGLGIVSGHVRKLPEQAVDGTPQKIPFVGWNTLDTFAGPAFYFAHSYMCIPVDSACIQASHIYGGHSIPAMIKQGAVTGCQFHPEKSGNPGLSVLRGFLA